MLPAQQAVALGEEVKHLNSDDGPRLQQIIWQLRGEVLRKPNDLDASTALTLALSLAGLAEASQEEALRSAGLLVAELNGPVRPPYWLHLNVVSALTNAGLEADARHCIHLMSREDIGSEDRPRFLLACTRMALRFGDPLLESPRAPSVALFMQRHNLASGWAEQQRKVEETLRPHVAYFDFSMARLDDGSTEVDRLVLTYNTDLVSARELDALEAQLWNALEEVHAHRPTGAGFLIGKVLFDLAGPRIPLEDPKP